MTRSRSDTTPDLVATLRRVELEAARAHRGIQTGAVPKGTSALLKIEAEAKDALARQAEREGVAA